MIYDTAVIGAGPCGMTAAMYAARGGIKVLLLEKSGFGGQMALTDAVENYPGAAKQTGYELTQKMREQIRALDVIEKRAEVTGLEHDSDMTFRLLLSDGEPILSRSVILANGVKRRRLGCPGEEKLTGKGVSWCAVCDGGFFRKKKAAVAGGGNTALEEALYLSNICSSVTVIHRRAEFRAAEILQKAVRERQNIRCMMNTTVLAVRGEECVEALLLQTPEGKTTLATDSLFVAIGLAPDNERFSSLLPLTEDGYASADENGRTAVSGLFAAGDTRSKLCRQIVTAASDGAGAATAVLSYLAQSVRS